MRQTNKSLEDKASIFNTVFFWTFKKINFNDRKAIITKLNKLSKKQIKQINKTLEECLKYPYYNFSDENLKIIKSGDIISIFEFLYPSYIEFEKLEEEKTNTNKDVLLSTGLSSTIVDELMSLLSSHIEICPKISGNDMFLEVIDASAYVVTVIFHNICFTKDILIDKVIVVNNFYISKESNKYIFNLTYECVEEDLIEMDLEFSCDDITQNIEFFNYNEFSTNFYNHNYLKSKLNSMLNSILSKHINLGNNFLTRNEKELLPLCSILLTKRYANIFDNSNLINFQKEGIEKLSEFCIELNDNKFLALLKKQRNKKRINTDYLISKLFCLEHKELALHIIDKLTICGNEFDSKVDKEVDVNKRKKAQKLITKHLQSAGFIGEFPTFKKMGQLKGIHNITTDFESHIVGCEKYMGSFIDCVESIEVGTYDINLICSTIFFRKDEVKKFDEFSAIDACFSNKGRTYTRDIKCGGYEFFGQKEHFSNMLHSLPDYIALAARMVTFEKLNKRDKQLRKAHIPVVYSKSLIAGFMLFASLFFGLAMFLGFCIITLILGIVFTGSFSETFRILTETVGFLFPLCMSGGIIFGVVMGILIMAGSKR